MKSGGRKVTGLSGMVMRYLKSTKERYGLFLPIFLQVLGGSHIR